MAKLVIFGTGDIAQIAKYYFETDSAYEIAAFVVDRQYKKNDAFDGKPLVAFEEITASFPPDTHDMFIALSYAQMNKLRAQKYAEAMEKGYTLASYISSRCSYLSQYPCGHNCFIFEDNTIQPFVRIGNNVTLWSGNHIGHHSVIEDHNFISSHVVLSGHCHIESYCFIGVNATLAHNIRLAGETLVGAAAVITKNTEPGGVYVPPKSVKLDKKSSDIAL